MIYTTQAITLIGLNGVTVSVEVDISSGWPSFHIVGLGDTSIQEAKQRIRSAWKSAGLDFPNHHRVVVNLAPAHIKKMGSSFDLAIAAGMYGALYSKKKKENIFFLGELGLGGELKPINGIIPYCLHAQKTISATIIIPIGNAHETKLIQNITILPANTLTEVFSHINDSKKLHPLISKTKPTKKTISVQVNLQDIKGHQTAKRALEIAASGGHNLLLSGPPGTGKSLLAKALAGILPPLSPQEELEINAIHSIANNQYNKYIQHRPFRNPHHSSSTPAIIGGGSTPRPGEISLAHTGVLFLDELPEFTRHTLESLRQPLEDKKVTIARSRGRACFPARCIVIGTLNPCPCGYLTHPTIGCTCRPQTIAQYQKKISGPLLDRFDMYIEVGPVSQEHLTNGKKEESSSQVQKRVTRAYKIQKKRFKQTKFKANADMDITAINQFCILSLDALSLLKKTLDSGFLSARGYDRMRKIGRTIADLHSSKIINKQHIAEALSYKKKPR